jgi:hypothetical protein
MKIDVSYEALLQALVQAIRAERDHGTAMMSLVSRLVEEACQQDWFDTHWRTDARLRLAQMACGHMPKGWRSAVPVLEVIAEAARWALKGDEIDSEARATLLAITRLADVERAGRTAAEPKPRPVAKHAPRRKANGAGRTVRLGRTAAQPARPAASPQAMAVAKPRPAAGKAIQVRKAKRAKPMSRSDTAAQPARPAASPQPMAVAKPRPAAAKATQVRKAKRAKPMSRSHTTARPARPAASPQTAPVAKAWPAAAKATQVRKAKRAKPLSRSHTAAQPAKPAAPPQPVPVAKTLSPVKAAPARKPNGAGQASTSLEAPPTST